MSKATKNVVQVTGTYKNADGEDKNEYQNIGVIIENDKGQESMKLNVLPLPNAKGEVWLQLYPVKEKEAPKAKK